MPAGSSDPAKPLRLFVALWPEGEIQDAIAAWQGSWHWPASVALVKTERLHLTLHFLGNVQSEQVPRLLSGLRVGFEPLALLLDRAEIWPKGLAVLRPVGAPLALRHLHEALGSALTGLGLPLEARTFRPHVTLARRAFGAVPPPQGPGLRWQPEGYALVRSLPGGGGYEVLQRFG